LAPGKSLKPGGDRRSGGLRRRGKRHAVRLRADAERAAFGKYRSALRGQSIEIDGAEILRRGGDDDDSINQTSQGRPCLPP